MTLLVTHNCINIRKKTGETDKHKTAALHFLLWTADSIIKNNFFSHSAFTSFSDTVTRDKKVRPYFTVKFTMNFPNMPKLTDKPEDIQ